MTEEEITEEEITEEETIEDNLFIKHIKTFNLRNYFGGFFIHFKIV